MSPERGDIGDRTNHRGRHLDRDVGSNQGGNISSPTEHVGTRAGTAATPEKRRHKTTSEENKKFDPGGKGEKAPLWNAAATLPFVFWGELGGSFLVLRVFCLCFVCALFSKSLFFSGDHFSTS